MKKFLIAGLAALACLSSFAVGTGTNRVLKDEQGNGATLLVEACTLSFLPDDVKNASHAARVVIDGKLYKACYIERNGAVLIIDEDQDVYGPFPSTAFVPVKEA
jgi:hypothetical protein